MINSIKTIFLRQSSTTMKNLLLSLLIITAIPVFGQVSVNTTGAAPDPSAMLDVSSTDKGVLVPRMSSGLRDSIFSPATGLLIYNTTTDAFNFYNGVQWVSLSTSGADNLGNHTATTDLDMNSNDIVNVDEIRTNQSSGKILQVGDDVWLEDQNSANTLFLVGQQNSDRANIRFGDDNGSLIGELNPDEITIDATNGIVADADLRMNGVHVIEMPNNIDYSQTTNDQNFGAGYGTVQSVTTTLKAGQTALLLAHVAWDHDDEEWVRFRFYRDGSQIGEDMEEEEDDVTGSYLDNTVSHLMWVDAPGAGTYTYSIRMDGNDDSDKVVYNCSLVVIKF